jgi:hypothetical protein
MLLSSPTAAKSAFFSIKQKKAGKRVARAEIFCTFARNFKRYEMV